MRFLIPTLAALSAVLLVPIALAGGPDRQRLPIGIIGDFPPGAICPASVAPAGVRIERLVGNRTLKTFDDGRILYTGHEVIQVTNLADPSRTVTHENHGSFSSVPQPDGTSLGRGSGTNGVNFFPGDAGPGDTTTARLYLFTGNISLTVDSTGRVVAFDSTQPGEDVCAQIAS
jgi:hypothetical protein